jgi:hypothetical protein
MSILSRILIGKGTGVALVQALFRFGKDDGSESAHTWHAAQDTNVELPITDKSIVRIQTDATGNPTAQQMKLQVKRSTGPESEWRDVPVE